MFFDISVNLGSQQQTCTCKQSHIQHSKTDSLDRQRSCTHQPLTCDLACSLFPAHRTDWRSSMCDGVNMSNHSPSTPASHSRHKSKPLPPSPAHTTADKHNSTQISDQWEEEETIVMMYRPLQLFGASVA